MLQIETVLCRAGSMDNYSYIIYTDTNDICAIIDPSESIPIINTLTSLNKTPKFILNTHHHFDHTDANIELKQKYDVKIIGNISDAHRIPEFDIGVIPEHYYRLTSSGINELATADNNPFTFKVIDVSAHTQGHVLYYFPQSQIVFTGDTLFNLCIGGLFEGTPEQMFNALQKIKKLPDNTLFYPGHEYTAHGAHDAYNYCNGNHDIQNYLQKAQNRLQKGLPVGPITLKEEQKCNPYLHAQTLNEFIRLFQ
ncbi:MAG: MBL fold metallo-hydrolase [Alphaproteobacteria bacterium]|nr:MBL fold metallo-hydrolase [Alphaproteobacteria bacterium]